MTARFRSAFFGSSGFVAVRAQVRVVAEAPAVRRDHRTAAHAHAAQACPSQAQAA